MYILKYKINKNNYVIISKYQKGGDYIFDEDNYFNTLSKTLRNDIVNIKNYDYIAGPIRVCFIENKRYNKRVLLFGDKHISQNIFKCGENDEMRTIYMTKFCNSLIAKNKNVIFDIFEEYEFIKNPEEFSSYFSRRGMIPNFIHTFDVCHFKRRDKINCKREIPNVRFHLMDIRDYAKSMTINEITSELEIFSLSIIKMIKMIGFKDYDKDRDREIATEIRIINSIVPTLYTDMKTEQKQKIDDDLKYMNDNSKTIDVNDLKRYENMFVHLPVIKSVKFSYGNLKDLINARDFYNGQPIALDEKFKKIIVKYIGNESGIYSPKIIKNNLWMFIENEERIRRNIGQNMDLLKNNFPFSEHLMDLTDQDKLTFIRVMSNSKIHNSYELTIFASIILIFASAIMDVYIIGRIFKKFIQKKSDDIAQEYANDIIIIAGDVHIQTYINFFQNIASDVHINEKSESRCVKNPKEILEKYYTL